MKRIVAMVSVAIWALVPGCAQPEGESPGDDRIRILDSRHPGQASLRRDLVVGIVQEGFALDAPDRPVGQAMVRVIYDDTGAPDHLIVYLLERDRYRVTVNLVRLAGGYQVAAIEAGYRETAADQAQDQHLRAVPACPDETIDFVFATMHTEIPSAVDGVETASESMAALGYSVKSIIGNGATVGAYKNWLSCPGLIGFGQIGHGYPEGISLADGMLYYSWFESLAADALTPTVVYFNSCDVHMAPLEPAVLGAGASRFVGGDISIAIGPSEEVFKCTWKEAVTSKTAMEPILGDCEEEHYFRGAHGISGDRPLPWNADGSECTSGETCDSGFCVDGVCCDQACTGACETCTAAGSAGICSPAADGASCADGDLCNGAESCQAGACAAAEPLDCDDGNQCTADTCDPQIGCLAVDDDGAACGGCGVCSAGSCAGDEGCAGGDGDGTGTVTGGCAAGTGGGLGGILLLVLGLLIGRRTRASPLR